MSNGTPETPVYDQEFFLKLARPRDGTDDARAEARERWNAWRRDPKNEGVEVTFEGVDFRAKENLRISFEGFEFGNGVRFTGATFGNWAQFGGATFGDWARFTGATFGEWAGFVGTRFGGWTRFGGVTFGFGARFAGAQFGDWAMFGGATFCGEVDFGGAKFGYEADFSGNAGDGDVTARVKGWAGLDTAELVRRETMYREQREAMGFGPSKFSDISFASARFRGSVSFARRSFERSADFTDVRFEAPPDFDGATNLHRIDFTGARAGFAPADHPWWKPDWTEDSIVAIRLRALRAQIEATKNHDFERDLYIEERKAERGIHLARLWESLRLHRAERIARAFLGTLPPRPRIDLFAGQGEPVVTWRIPAPNRRAVARPAFVDGGGPAAVRLRRAYRREGARVVQAVGPLLGHCVWIAVMGLYWALSDYGRSWLRPAGWLVATLLVFHGLGPIDGLDAHLLAARRGPAIERATAGNPAVRADVADQYDEAVRLYAVANSVPFVGPLTIDGDLKKFLFCGETGKSADAGRGGGATVAPCVPLPPSGLQAATILQNLLSILLVFFIGLALRNYFRLK